MPSVTVNVPMNRVEGDLEISLDIDGGVVTDARACGTLYRGFEKVLIGRGAMDGLVITPRVCGICSTSHLAAAATALDRLTGSQPPPGAIRMRNVCLIAEHLQSDMRQSFLTFACDFANPAFQAHPRYAEAKERYEPFQGETAIETLRATRGVLEIVAILGGQWPHSSHMVPGGVAFVPLPSDLLKCRHLLKAFQDFYERRVLGCPIARWREVTSRAALEAWLAESPRHRESDLGFFLDFARSIGLHETGRGYGSFISYGSLERPEDTSVVSISGSSPWLFPSGFAQDTTLHEFDSSRIGEHIAYSWFVGYDGSRHPSQGVTQPYATGHEAHKYSWAKATRYGENPAETGPLAELILARDPLIHDFMASEGPSTLLRQLARILRPAYLIPAAQTWLGESSEDGPYYVNPGPIPDGSGAGLVEASRGALGHWISVKGGKIDHYQIITPTGWNASPRDTAGMRGPLEEALIGTPVEDCENPVLAGFVVRSFDPCLVCTVHSIDRGRSRRRVTFRM
ncbi:MAG: nickel-dependent hydrogenase large subunit [Acidobacteria bacterium]|nr:nickel-dependent hydrogenase large subunit [Acidobacteriota bacterium]MCG3191589.1 Periplasmic [NiFeSe] hydrogenase large subunit [Thermoanaerobaculia bacterium]